MNLAVKHYPSGRGFLLFHRTVMSADVVHLIRAGVGGWCIGLCAVNGNGAGMTSAAVCERGAWD